MKRTCLAVLVFAIGASFFVSPLGAQEQLCEEDAAVWKKLKESRATLDFADTPLSQLIEFFRETSGINIVIDPVVWEEGYGEQPLSIRLKDLSLDQALCLLLQMAELDFRVSRGCVIVTTPDRARPELVTRIHDVRDLLAYTPDFTLSDVREGEAAMAFTPEMGAILVDMVITSIEPESWDEAGCSLEFRQGLLFVRNRQPVQDKIAWLLSTMRTLGTILVRIEVRFVSGERGLLREVMVTGDDSAAPAVLSPSKMKWLMDACAEGSRARLVRHSQLVAHNTQRVTIADGGQVSLVTELTGDGTLAEAVMEGLALEVRPIVTGDRRAISLEVRSTLASLFRPVRVESFAGDPLHLPTTREQVVRTTLLVPDGETALVGGCSWMDDRGEQQELLLLLTAESNAVKHGDAAQVIVAEREGDEATRHIMEALRSKTIQLDMEQAPLPEVIELLRENTGLNILIDTSGVDDPCELTITFAVKDCRLDHALELMLDLHNLAYLVKEGVLVITSSEQLYAELCLELYDVRDLLVEITDYPGPYFELSYGELAAGESVLFEEEEEPAWSGEDLVECIRESVGDWIWDELEEARIELQNGVLLVVAPPQLHAGIQALLKQLREASSVLVTMEAVFVKIEPQRLAAIQQQADSFDPAQLAEILNRLEEEGSGEVLGSCLLTGYNTQRVYLTQGSQFRFVSSVDEIREAQREEQYVPVIGTGHAGIVFDVKPVVSGSGEQVTVDVRSAISRLKTPMEKAHGGKREDQSAEGQWFVDVPELSQQLIQSSVALEIGKYLILGGSAATGGAEEDELIIFLRASKSAFQR